MYTHERTPLATCAARRVAHILLGLLFIYHIAPHTTTTHHHLTWQQVAALPATAAVATNAPQLLAPGGQLVHAVAASGLAPAQAPRSERAPIVEMFGKFFLKARSHNDQAQKELVRDGVIRRLQELGLEEAFLQKSKFEFQRRPAMSYNMIGVIPGKHRRTKNEKIVLVGAHWDSATKAPGVDDNGSGSTCLLEIARLLAKHKCKLEHTLMLVWFDYEEQGKYGSEFFVNDYLYPYELDRYGSKFVGAYILDMILVRDKENNTQTLPASLRAKLGDFFEELEREKSRGDFLATWSRKHWDEPLENVFRYAWQDLGYEARTFKAMRPELPQARLPNAEEKYDWKDFFRSDHASFWFPPLTSTPVRRAPNRTSGANHASLNAILLTDLGPWRKSYSKCYHSACDDEHLLTEGNLAFMQQVVDALVLTVLRTCQGECQLVGGSNSTTTTANLGGQPPAARTSWSVALASNKTATTSPSAMVLGPQMQAVNATTAPATTTTTTATTQASVATSVAGAAAPEQEPALATSGPLLTSVAGEKGGPV